MPRTCKLSTPTRGTSPAPLAAQATARRR